MPFVTEELWQQVKPKDSAASIMVAAWPEADKKLINAEAEKQFASFQAVVTAIRTTRAELNVPVDRKPSVHLIAKDAGVRSFFKAHGLWLQALAQVSEVAVSEQGEKQKDTASAVVDGVEVLLPLAGLIDKEKETQRLKQRVAELARWLESTSKRLNDPQFTGKAPAEVIEQTKAQQAQNQETLKKLNEYLSVLQAM